MGKMASSMINQCAEHVDDKKNVFRLACGKYDMLRYNDTLFLM